MTRFSFRRPALVVALAMTVPAMSSMTAHAATSLPYRSSCQDIRHHNHHARNGNYTIYNDGNIFTVYCYGMNSNPRSYINLAATGLNANFSQYTAGGASPGTNVRTRFTKLRINPATMTVDIGDLTFATSTGSLNQGGTTVTSMPYGVAMSCVAPLNTSGAGNINLAGTPFQVSNTFAVGGFEAAGSAAVSPDHQVVNLTGGGYCGWITPSPVMYNPFNPSTGEYHLVLSCAQRMIPRRHRFEICVHVR